MPDSFPALGYADAGDVVISVTFHLKNHNPGRIHPLKHHPQMPWVFLCKSMIYQ